eukprot:SAG22_NODE_1199_length_5185_cov_5.251278_3_plen_112_part_00
MTMEAFEMRPSIQHHLYRVGVPLLPAPHRPDHRLVAVGVLVFDRHASIDGSGAGSYCRVVDAAWSMRKRITNVQVFVYKAVYSRPSLKASCWQAFYDVATHKSLRARARAT